MQNIAAITVYK